MFNHRFDQNANNVVVLHWFLLSFNGGAINAGGFLATGRFVSHVTGFATLFGVDVTSHQVEAAFGILSVPLFFLLGAFIAGLLIDRPIYQGRRPHFDWVMGLSASCLFFAVGVGELLRFGTFGDSIGLKENYVLLVLLCLASGLQNAAITSSSGRSVRTTHLTGLTTDLGLGLARVLAFDLKQTHLQVELRANYLRIGSISAFIVGSAIGAWIFLKFGYKGFILPGLISVYAAWHGKKAKLEMDIRWIQRLDNYKSALQQLLAAVKTSEQRPLSDLEKQGAIQAFEFTHELAWNVLKDYFEYQGNSSMTGSRDATREAFQKKLILDGDAWMAMIKSRNLTSHTYNKNIADDIVKKITQLYAPAFVQFDQKMDSLKP